MKIQIKTTRQSFKEMNRTLYNLCTVANRDTDGKQFFDWVHVQNIKRISRMLNSRTLPESHKKQVAFTIDHNEVCSLHHFHGAIAMVHPLNELLLDNIYKEATKKLQIELNIIKSRQHD